MLTVDDITDDWVLKNFDIDKERKYKYLNVRREIWEILPYDAAMEVHEWIERLTKAINEVVDAHFNDPETSQYRNDAQVLVQSCRSYNWEDSYEEFIVFIRYQRPETDKQVVSRLKSREKQKIKAAKTRKEKVNKEKREYERLKKKFEK